MKRYSRKREAILEAIRSTDTHPSAEWVYLKLKPDYPDLSLGTVYRNIGDFIEDGTLISVANVAGHERFDGCVSPHAHFICDVCGRIIDVPELSHPLINDDEIGAAIGAEISYHAVTFRGRCPECSKASE